MARLNGRSRLIALVALGGVTAVGELTSLGKAIERTPVLRDLDRIGRQSL